MSHDFNVSILVTSIVLPIVCSIAVLMMNGRGYRRLVNSLALSGFAFPMLCAFYLFWQYSQDPLMIGGFAFVNITSDGLQSIASGKPLNGYDVGVGLGLLSNLLGIRFSVGLNSISLPMFVMAGIVGFAAGWQSIHSHFCERRNIYIGLMLLMQAGLMGVFASIDVFFFYFFHEFALIPTFILMGIWGGAAKRTITLEVAIYLSLGAMLSLVGLIGIYVNAGVLETGFNFITLQRHFASQPMDLLLQKNLAALLLLGFGTLVSLFPFHSWAPKAYSTAPLPNAMLHAGVLKKFGLYGLIQIAAPLLGKGILPWSDWIVVLALGNIVVIGLITCAQTDLKQMISYSSVMHMGYLFLGIASLSTMGVGGATLLMFAHGLSVALSFLLGQYIYDRTKTWDMNSMGGLGPKAPLLSALFVAVSFAGAGLPGFANFWGELPIFLSLGKDFSWALIPALTGIVLSAVYSLRAVAKVFFGEPTSSFKPVLDSGHVKDLTLNEKIPAYLLIATLLAVGFFPKIISDGIHNEIQKFKLESDSVKKVTQNGN